MVKIKLRVYGWATIEVEEATPKVIEATENGTPDWESKAVGNIIMDDDATVDIVE